MPEFQKGPSSSFIVRQVQVQLFFKGSFCCILSNLSTIKLNAESQLVFTSATTQQNH